MTDRKRILEKVTCDWQSTNNIANLLRIHWGVCLGILGMLCKDGYVEYLEVKRLKSTQYLWRLADG